MATKAQKPTDMIKMLIFPAVYMFSGKIDFKDPQVIQYCQIGFTSGSYISSCKIYPSDF